MAQPRTGLDRPGCIAALLILLVASAALFWGLPRQQGNPPIEVRFLSGALRVATVG